MSTLTESPTPVDERDRHVAWRDVLRGAATGQVVMAAFMFLITVALEQRFDPMSLVIGALVAVGVVLLTKRRGKGGVIYAGVMSLLLLLMVVMFGGLTVLTRVRSTFELILMGGLLVVSLLGLVATVGALRHAGGPAAAAAPKVAGACIAGLVVVGVVAGILTGSASRLPGDISLEAKHFAFSEEVIEADAGRVGVFVENGDVAHHDFTIEGIVAIDLPGQKAGRAAFDVEPGTYRFYCSLHPDMEGELAVS